MRWLKRDMWKHGTVLAGLLFFLVLMIWIPISAVNAYEGMPESAPLVTATVQATPTEDATMTAMKKEQLTQQVRQLDNWWLYWLYNGSTAFIAAITAIIVASIGLYQWRGNQNAERKKEMAAQDKDLLAQAEERFKTAIAALGDEKEGTKVGGAILLRSFLNPDDEKIYGRYYTQIFNLAVAYLGPLSISRPSENPDEIPHPPVDPNTVLPLTPLRQNLIVVFKEAFPLARNKLFQTDTDPRLDVLALEASRIRLDRALLTVSDLQFIWMRETSLNEANLAKANLYRINLKRASLVSANLSGASLNGANLCEALLDASDFTGANLTRADLNRSNLEDAQSLQGTDLRRAKGLTKKQLQACKAKGAIIDEDISTSPPQPTVSSAPPLQSNNAQASPVPPAQVNTPPPTAVGRNLEPVIK